MLKTRVAILRGGPSSEHAVSLQSGVCVITNLPEQYSSHDLYIDKKGLWHTEGVSRDPLRALRNADVVFNALHGEYGEDGRVQHILDSSGVPYTGSGAVASALGMNKVLTKRAYMRVGIRTPYAKIIHREGATEHDATVIFNEFPHPAVVKPVSAGSSVGVRIVYTYQDLLDALERVFVRGQDALIEEYIPGKEASCGVVEGYRGEGIYTLPPTEITPNNVLFDYEAKYEGQSEERCPGRFCNPDKEELQRLAREIHQLLGLRHYSRTDFIIHPRRGIFVLETNTLPGLTKESIFPQALAAIGCKMPEFIDHVITRARTRQLYI